jgi:hypothetical protein
MGDETYCFAHAPDAVARAKRAAKASVQSRRDASNRRKEALEVAKLGVDGWIARLAAERDREIAESLVKAAIADGSSPAMKVLLDRHLGKVIDRVQTVTDVPFEMDVEQLQAWLNSPATED